MAKVCNFWNAFKENINLCFLPQFFSVFQTFFISFMTVFALLDSSIFFWNNGIKKNDIWLLTTNKTRTTTTGVVSRAITHNKITQFDTILIPIDLYGRLHNWHYIFFRSRNDSFPHVQPSSSDTYTGAVKNQFRYFFSLSNSELIITASAGFLSHCQLIYSHNFWLVFLSFL